MNRTLIWLLFTLAGPFCGSAQTMDQLSKTVVLIRHKTVETFPTAQGPLEVWLKLPNTNSFIPKTTCLSGTGFFVAGRRSMFLVTAKHLALELGFSENDDIVLCNSEGETRQLPMSQLRGAATGSWLHHESVDVSVLPISPAESILTNLLTHKFLMSTNLELGTNCPSRDITLTVTGFPLSLGSGGEADSFSPISLQTKAASGFLRNGTCFVLQDPSVQGYSGGPVYKISQNSIHFGAGRIGSAEEPAWCVGIVSGTFSDNTGGKLSDIVPIKFVLELMNKYEATLPQKR